MGRGNHQPGKAVFIVDGEGALVSCMQATEQRGGLASVSLHGKNKPRCADDAASLKGRT